VFGVVECHAVFDVCLRVTLCLMRLCVTLCLISFIGWDILAWIQVAYGGTHLPPLMNMDMNLKIT
jgi:hypothetical protein